MPITATGPKERWVPTRAAALLFAKLESLASAAPPSAGCWFGDPEDLPITPLRSAAASAVSGSGAGGVYRAGGTGTGTGRGRTGAT